MVAQSPAPPRRKSCEACKVSKRRCDLTFPACSRCIQRNIPCVYPGRQPAASASFDLDMPPLEAGPQFPVDSTFTTGIDLHATSSFAAPVTDALCVGSNYVDYQPPISWQEPSSAVSLQPVFDITNPRARPPKPLSEIVASRLQFSMDILRDAPRSMVIENQAPWCHPKLYKSSMPRVMQDAYGCCSLYTSKNEINAPVIMSLIDARIQDLLSAPEPLTLVEVLAHTHALLLYQIMHLFDGDIRSQATSNAIFAALQSISLSLLALVQFPDRTKSIDLLPLSMEPIIDFWESWVLHESARRTVLFTFYFLQIYKLLQGDRQLQCDGKLGLYHSWYLSAHLWNAQSAFDFAVAWADHQHFIIDNLDFSWALSNAQPDDVDSFGKMLLVTVLGIDGVKAWFHTRGALL
ncbi:hypothetical protein N7492_008002 [Penicillium capsulatum]|uniref:Zn(2)-C6 fungal-type domain-containing protein n=1 Tax=Penicillium capsulatum TaxID=69766 RepID=A0A9W9HRQ1_9EURO|nr:hypothetical protein N7492_008002 [Penicillium capsulatum]KAJ6105409.1 hypothetical protein N7512_008926 [Penicillium capsulatum]